MFGYVHLHPLNSALGFRLLLYRVWKSPDGDSEKSSGLNRLEMAYKAILDSEFVRL